MSLGISKIIVAEKQFTEELILRFYRIYITSIIGSQTVGKLYAEYSYLVTAKVVAKSDWSDEMNRFSALQEQHLDAKHFRWNMQLNLFSYVLLIIIGLTAILTILYSLGKI